MKRGQVAVFVIIALMLVFAVAVTFVFYNRGVELEVECVSDADCVPTDCCHSSSCVAVDDAPLCQDVFCSEECAPGTLDCGQGSCLCVAGRCRAEIN